MARVLLENLAVGMRLKKPVLNLQGVLLLKAGEVLTEKHLRVFKALGVREAEVLRGEDSEPGGATPVILGGEIPEAVRAEAAHRFRRADAETDPVMAEILRLVTLRLASRQAAPPAARKQPGPETA